MSAVVKPNYDPNRQNLADIIPLPAPFTVYIEPTRFCNFKCFYCIHSTRDDKDGEFQKLGYEIKHMEFNDFSKIVKDLQEFPKDSIKRIVFSGLGEPLANPELPEMIKMISESQIASRVEVITNGLLLTPELIDKLVTAGLTNINISIQGLSEEKYEQVCAKKIDFERFLKNLDYLYKNKKSMTIYIKIIDAALKNEEEKEKFYNIFSKFADKIYVEHLIQMQEQLDQIKDKVDKHKNFYGEDLDLNRQICAPSFYFLQIGCELDTFPCPVPGLKTSISFGNARNNSLQEIWNSKRRINFLKNMLKFQKNKYPECADCLKFNCITDSRENLDKDAENLLKRFE